jgi:DNA invertase Pin-like site-specific DNA recombinase
VRAQQGCPVRTDVDRLSAVFIAVSHGIEIVITYEDSSKCELAINGRPALRQLIANVASGPDVFDTILVYDVSRWGALPACRQECD